MGVPTYQETILTLERYWADQGCVLLQPYHTEVGAGTFNPATFLRCLGPDPWKTAYVEPSIRPFGRALRREPVPVPALLPVPGVLKPAPEDVLDLYFESLRALGIDTAQARRSPRRGRLGRPDPRRLGPRAGRSGSTAWR